MIKIILLIVAGVLTTIGVVKIADRQTHEADTLALLVTVCELDSTSKRYESLIDVGVSRLMFSDDRDYRAAICDKTASAAKSEDFSPLQDLDSFTHHYAKVNGISLSDSYTSRWPYP